MGISNVQDNGYDGLVIIPRWATTIYYNCHTAECTTREWIETSGGYGDFHTLLENAKMTNTRYLLGLHHDPYMFHQANLKKHDEPEITVGTQTAKMSLVEAWVEVIAQEMYRLTNWPIISLPQDEISRIFVDRMALDQCKPKLRYDYNNDGTKIEAVTLETEGNTC